MTLNEQLLEFVDGGLNPDQEAELLHRLSVSPERRAVLRNFLNQKAIFGQDRLTMQVPYAAETKLWSKLDALMPIGVIGASGAASALADGAATTAAVQTVAQSAGSAGLLSQIFTVASSTLAAATLLAGLGLGYFFATSNANIPQQAANISSTQGVQRGHELASNIPEAPPIVRNERSNERAGHGSTGARHYGQMAMYGLPWPWLGQPGQLFANTEEPAAAPQTPIPTLDARTAPERAVMHVVDPGATPVRYGYAPIEPETKTLLQRFEFSFSESFGKQYPNTTATNVSVPLVTNSSINAFFQVFPRSRALWVGLGAGSANITSKMLLLTNDPAVLHQQKFASDLSHVQANWIGGFLQGRTPIFSGADLLTTGGYGISSAGKMLSLELGLHYDATREVGFQVGVRALRVTYDLTQQKNDLVSSRTERLAEPSAGLLDATPSYNVELNTGLYFHF